MSVKVLISLLFSPVFMNLFKKHYFYSVIYSDVKFQAFDVNHLIIMN